MILSSPRNKATLIGSMAILMWSTLAPMTALSGAVPPFLLMALGFSVAFISGTVYLIATRGRGFIKPFIQPRGFWLLALSGLFFYHAFYFIALKTAPAAEANIINYLWPLLIVLFSGMAAGEEKLTLRKGLGAALGFSATLLILAGNGLSGTLSLNHMLGYLAAIGCAITWAGYSVMNRRYARVPSEAMIGVCGAVAVLGALCHFLFEAPSAWPVGYEWLAIVVLGLGPVGLSFLVWDYGTKHGSLSTLGTLAYAAPVLSTLLLIVFGAAEPSLSLILAVILVVAGAWLATSRRRLAKDHGA